MKGLYPISVLIIFICMVLFPLLSMNDPTPSASGPQAPQSSPTADVGGFRILNTETEKVTEISARDYCIGVVLAEMPAEYEIEALKAQSVVAYTYAKYKANIRKNEKYDVTDTYLSDQAFLWEQEARDRFGENYQAYYKKVSSAVDSVLGQMITYDGQPILAACHSISGGRTESAEKIWGGSYPYLQPVESVGDVLNPDYLSEVTLTPDEMSSKLKEISVTTEGSADGWFSEFKKTDSGTVLTANVCGHEIKGSDIRTALGLRSSNFDLELKDGNFHLAVRGYGHGVGMSQYGAQFMAEQGSTYTEILGWYFTNCRLAQPS
ncbi:MAG: stage II sporulation protein D [Clostridia bacterium]|nr:stage II sporulation protein D [Clostridia bacterium]